MLSQPQATHAVADALLRSHAGLSRPHQPLGSFLFLGSTGVGKTELAKSLAAELFETKSLVRLDMSEYMEEHSVARLIGSPPGYVGHEEGGQLTEALRRDPYNIVLLDEIEKAHPKILNILLQLLDEGRLTDGRGVEVDFSNCVIVLTSNIGSGELANALDWESAKNRALLELKAFLRPEILNRLDEVVVFSPLGETALRRIVRLQLDQVGARILEERGVRAEFSEGAVELVLRKSREGLGGELGARPVKRLVQRSVVTEISKMLLRDELKSGGTVRVGEAEHELTYEVTEAMIVEGSDGSSSGCLTRAKNTVSGLNEDRALKKKRSNLKKHSQ